MTKPTIGDFVLGLAYQYLFGKDKGEEEKPQIPELGEIAPIIKLRHKEGSVIIVLGRRESGKTVVCQRLAEIIGRPTYMVSPEQKPPNWIQELKLEQLAELPPPNSTLILDDLPTYMGSRSYQDALVQQVEHLIPVVRHRRKIILIFSSQTSGQADKWVMDADLIIMKAMGWLYSEVERPAVKKLADSIMPAFRSMSEYQQKRHCFLFSDDYKGLVRIDLPKVS